MTGAMLVSRRLKMKNTKIAGVSIWIWLLGLVVCLGVAVIAVPKVQSAMKPAPLEIVKKELWKNAGTLEVRGQVFNPRRDPARNVKVAFKLFYVSYRGGTSKKVFKASTQAVFDYIPAKGVVDFTAVTSQAVTRDDWEIDEGVITEVTSESDR